jgi:hypothetical protein
VECNEDIWITRKINRLIQEMYKNYTCQVEHNGKLSEPMTVKSGVKQGCLLLPILFVVVLDNMMTKTMSRKQIVYNGDYMIIWKTWILLMISAFWHKD